ncbi:hypothetical protein QCA50_019992 [Cerrena zonata]|uniref:Uncharacterized protein n=1 Tax=Cerrena zonata TaxID=2478898 RepID=A0AAW0FD41_9APHY
MPFGLSDDMQDQLDHGDNVDRTLDDPLAGSMFLYQDEDDEDEVVDANMARRDIQMQQAENMMATAGASDSLTVPLQVDVEVQDGDSLSSSAWKALLAQKKEAILNQRDMEAAKKIEQARKASHKFANRAEVIDATFLNETFRAADQKDQCLIDTNDPVRGSDVIPPKLQQKLWNLPPTNTDQRPGQLSLCYGMPVMIKYNEATECGVTNGSEGIVVGWKAKEIATNKQALDVLFVKLTFPPVPLQLDGLPEKWKDQQDLTETRPFNVIDLNNCKNHQSVYTCLSRGSSAKGTLIIQGFSDQKVTGGLSGFLRQEFRELELLDKITELRYYNKLPDKIQAETRRALIGLFRKWKGENYMPDNTHQAIQWSEEDPLVIEEPEEPVFKIIDKNTGKPQLTEQQKAAKHIQINMTAGFVPAKGTKVLNITSSEPGRRKGAKHHSAAKPVNRFVDAVSKQQDNQTGGEDHLQGFVWNETLTCAYDSLWTILLGAYKDDVVGWNETVKDENASLALFTQLIDQTKSEEKTLEQARDQLRQYFHSINPVYFPVLATTSGTGIDNLCSEMFVQPQPIMTVNLTCISCDLIYQYHDTGFRVWDCAPGFWRGNIHRQGSYKYAPLQSWIPVLLHEMTRQRCPDCNSHLQRHYHYDIFPSFLAFNVFLSLPKLDSEIDIQGKLYRLCGVVYHGDFHFTSRIMTADSKVWHYDGMTRQGVCKYEGLLENMEPSVLRKAYGKTMSMAIYIKK